jgi:hypothetical protein
MRRRFLASLILIISVAAWGQQGSSPDSPPAKSPGQNAPAKSASQAPTPSTPDELKFPEDDPSEPAPPPAAKAPAPKPSDLAPPRSDSVPVQDLGPAVGESSSKDDAESATAPDDDSKAHPHSSDAVANAEAESLSSGGVTEIHSWDPHKAAKDVEVGDFYFRRKNYRAAEERYRDALLYKDNDAIATIRLAISLEKLGILDDARAEYESYLRILPHGPKASEAEKGIARLKAMTKSK